jgi:signal transduction histidine kinase
LGNYKEALTHFELSKQILDSVNEQEQQKVISEIDIQYKTKEKELENLKLKNVIEHNKIIIYVAVSLLLVLLIIGFLYYKNATKKAKIIAQEKEIDQKTYEKKIKDQELLSIDKILESQEKERQNIANEIHDDLGSMLATLKLNFQNLKRQKDEISNQENKLYEKTDTLIEEAYQKIRTISHLKNLGVIGTEGLLVAVNQMAEKMSVLGKINFQVFPFGLDQRLENTLEVFIFRMIQELCTNSIKHADATEVNIYLTQEGNNEINIIIEDNGKGFDKNNSFESEGIGLKSIEKKVEQLGGTFTVDSILTKGTTIVIDLPI